MALALRNPLSTLGVTFAIHWQALLLWIRGARYHSRPALPELPATVAHSSNSIVTASDSPHER